MNILHLTFLIATSICCSLTASSSHGEQVASTPSQNHMLVVITSTAQTQEIAQKDAERLKTDFVYALFKEIGLKPTTVSSSGESKINSDKSHTYKLTMTGYVRATPQRINDAIGTKTPATSQHDADRFLITGLSVSNISGIRHKGPYHDIQIVVSSSAGK